MRGLVALLWLFSLASALELRVLLFRAPEGEVRLLGGHAVWGPAGVLLSRGEGASYRVRYLRGQLWLEGKPVGDRLSFVPRSGDLEVAGRRYPGFLRVLARDGGALWINVVELETYLEGVLPGEMPASFPLEALKAQAVIARTYALSRLGSDPDYDLCATSRCQVYLGRVEANPRYRAAIRATRGRLLAYRGRPVKAVYHADSGGRTASSREVWGKAYPYLRTQPDPYTRARLWRLTPDAEAVRRALSRLGIELGQVAGFEVLGRTESGRIGALRVRGSGGTAVLRTPQVTAFLRALGLPSTLARLEDGWTFVGQGSGHGVGLSQWGAKGLAERGYGWRAILGHYYPGTVLAPYVVEARR